MKRCNGGKNNFLINFAIDNIQLLLKKGNPTHTILAVFLCWKLSKLYTQRALSFLHYSYNLRHHVINFSAPFFCWYCFSFFIHLPPYLYIVYIYLFNHHKLTKMRGGDLSSKSRWRKKRAFAMKIIESERNIKIFYCATSSHTRHKMRHERIIMKIFTFDICQTCSHAVRHRFFYIFLSNYSWKLSLVIWLLTSQGKFSPF